MLQFDAQYGGSVRIRARASCYPSSTGRSLMSYSWALKHFQRAKEMMPTDSPSWHLAEGLEELTKSLERRLTELEEILPPKA